MSNMKLLSMSLTLIVATLIIPSSAEMEQPTQRFCNTEDNIDYRGNDIRMILVDSVKVCQESCLQEAKCAGYTFVKPKPNGKHRCYLKHKMQNKRGLKIAISGFCSASGGTEKTSALAIAEVEIRDGRAQASSSHPAPWTADKAFILGHANAWINAGTGHAIFPAMVWYEFHVENTFAPGRISFRPRKDCCLDQGPTVWQFIGSNDENCGRYGNWTVLCEDQSNAGYSSHYWTKYCDVDEKIFKKFRCLGISVLNTPNPTGIASLKDVRMWKKKYE